MRYSPLLLFILWWLLQGSAPVAKSADKKLIKDYVFIPAGNVGDTAIAEFYISSIEVTNQQYRDFVNELQDSGALDKVKIVLPDSAQWDQVLRPCGPYLSSYFRHPAYNDYPVVNISRHAAELYCTWLTEKYNATAKIKVHFLLPTEIQWEYAAKGGNLKAIYPWPGNSIQYQKKGRYHGCNMCNYSVDSAHRSSSSPAKVVDITSPSRSYTPNTYEIYNMAGNVAEMLADQPYTKGGSYLSPGDKVLISAHEYADLTHGSPFIGFRPVMVIER